MLSFVTGILSSLSAADAEKMQSRNLRQRGNIAQANAARQASAIMRTADDNWEIASDKRKAYRRKQTHAVAAARNRSAFSGFTSQGTGSIREVSTIAEFDQILDNLNRDAAITYTNYFNNANATRTQGLLQKEAYYAEAQQHDIAARAIRTSTAVSAAVGAGAGIYGYLSGVQDAEKYNAENADAIRENKLSAINPTAQGILRAGYYAGELYNNTLGYNPATVSLTRKNNWGAFAAIAQGTTPGFYHSEYSL